MTYLTSKRMFFRKTLISRSFSAALVAVLFLLIAPSPARAETQLERTRRQIAETKKRLAAAKGKAAEIEKEVKTLDSQIAALNREITKGQKEINGLESEIRSAEANIAELEEKFQSASKASNERARRIYKDGPAQALDRLLTSKSMSEFVRLQVLWEVSAEIDGKIMLDAARLKRDLAFRKEELGAVKADVESRRTDLKERRALVAEARSGRNSALQSVEQEVAQLESHLAGLEADSRRVSTAIRGSLSKSSGGVSRAGFIWPLSGQVTSGYGRRWGRMHTGIDIDGETGDPIRASKAGSVAGVSCGGGYGICTILDHGNGVSTLYAHQVRKAVTGGSVEQGEVIGYVGSTGNSTGSHLHFEVRVNGDPQNPMNFLP